MLFLLKMGEGRLGFEVGYLVMAMEQLKRLCAASSTLSIITGSQTPPKSLLAHPCYRQFNATSLFASHARVYVTYRAVNDEKAAPILVVQNALKPLVF